MVKAILTARNPMESPNKAPKIARKIDS
ncbi:uncharacterized protein METZ01_LOCUS122965, partial [marine metagenome]